MAFPAFLPLRAQSTGRCERHLHGLRADYRADRQDDPQLDWRRGQSLRLIRFPMLRSPRRNDDSGADRGQNSQSRGCNRWRTLCRQRADFAVALGAHCS